MTIDTPPKTARTAITLCGSLRRDSINEHLRRHLSAKLREACVLIVGPPGSGKTTLLDSIIAGLVRCADTVVWGIDVGKRGGAFRKWSSDLPPGATRGVWPIAANHRQALDMINAAIRIAEDRATGSKLLAMSAAQPQIEIVIDEGAEIL